MYTCILYMCRYSRNNMFRVKRLCLNFIIKLQINVAYRHWNAMKVVVGNICQFKPHATIYYVLNPLGAVGIHA